MYSLLFALDIARGVEMEAVKEISYGLCRLQVKRGDIKFLYGDHKFAEIIGYEPEEVTADNFSVKQILSEQTREEVVHTISKQLKERQVVCAEIELLKKNYGTIHTMCCFGQYYDPKYETECVLAVIMDVTKERMDHKEMQEQIERDSMTGLYNRNAIEQIVNDILHKDTEGQHVLYLIDIDNFKAINDTFGHVFGDTVIRDLASSIVKAFPARARIGRIGGDEFVVFLQNAHNDEIKTAAERMRKHLCREITADFELIQISGSIGVAICREDEDYQMLAKRADAAMYFAKDSGKNQYAFFEDFMMSEFKQKSENLQRGRILEQTYDVDMVFFAYQLLTDSKQFDSSMNLLLERVVERFGLDRVSVFEYQGTEEYMRRTNTGASAKAARMGESECYMSRSWLEKNINSQGQLILNEVIPGENVPSLSNYITIPKSFVINTLKENGTICGCVIFVQYLNKRNWTSYEIRTFQELTKAMAVFSSLRRDKTSNLQEIHRLSTRDKVTGLLDLRNFEIRLENYIRHCKGFNCLALVYVDINNFSYINERYGTNAGNEVLGSYGKLLMSGKETLLAGRIFSDCFLCLHINENREKAIKKIRETHEIMSEILKKKYPVLGLQFKCGIYFLEDETCTVHEAIENANMARKSIKDDGRTDYYVYNSDLRENRCKEQEIIMEFLESVKNNRLELYLQPSFRIDTKEMKSVEAFCRWHNEEGIERKSQEIISVLKQKGYILEWDLAVFEQVLRRMSLWKKKGAELPIVEVNFSTLDFLGNRIVGEIVRLAQKYEIDPSGLVIEMSEEDLSKAPKKVFFVLQELRRNGFRIGIDNFGNNYSSFELLVDESVDVIKTGKNLLHTGREPGIRNEYLRYIRGIVQDASKEIVLVGAENEQQEQEIRKCGYSIVQGYLYERELPVEVFEAQYIKTKELYYE